jgi:transcriptional regulator with XRE-family HTH domain
METLPGFLTPEDIKEKMRDAVRKRRIGMDLTQEELAARAGISLATLKRFEKRSDGTLATVLAEALDALDGFRSLFPPIEARTLDDLERQRSEKTRQRVRKGKLS